jgi:hypothetical protein
VLFNNKEHNRRITAFWDIATFSLDEIGWGSRDAFCRYHQDPDDGGSTHLCDIGILQRDYSLGSWWWEAVLNSETSICFNETNHYPDDGGNAYLWNVGLLQRDYSSGSWLWKAVLWNVGLLQRDYSSGS